MRFAITLLCAGIVVGLSGCSVERDLVATHHITVQNDPGDNAIISGPDVIAKGDDVVISGVVSRKPGNTTPMAGHVEISVLDDSGAVSDTVEASLSPRTIPTAGERRSTFTFQALGVPPEGSTIKATFVDELHPSTQDLLGFSSEMGSGGGGGGHSGGGGGGGGIKGEQGPHLAQGVGRGSSHGFHFGGVK
jgi:hypothetical protein